nr:Splicing factor 3B subunit 2 [Euglena gracilis]
MAPSEKRKKRHKKVKSGREAPLGPPEEKDSSRIEIEYVAATGLSEAEPFYEHFKEVFEKLQPKAAPSTEKAPQPAPDQEKAAPQPEQLADGEKPLSRKQRKKLKRLDVAQLKQLVARPDVVEIHDATAADPKMLVYLKSYRNTVPVPKHWSQKRKYLQGKRGFIKPPFALPAFIADTGIAKIRQNYMEREEAKKAKLKQKDKINPKMGRVDIDYQVLHDAFFKYQTKPKMTRHGDLYYEGKEFEVRLPDHRPGHLSDRLKKALGMPEGAPPPWLINMQRHGPPPAYANMKIPGLSAPIPPGASYGYHPGGWGKPPVDEFGQPLYGDVFGTEPKDTSEEPTNTKLWGEMDEDEAAEDEDEDMDEDAEVDEGGFMSTAPPLSEAGLTETTQSATGTDTGTETPDVVQIKKYSARDDGRPLYQTLEVQKASVGANIMGSAYTYAVPRAGEVDVSLNPGELDQYQDPELAKEKYNRALEEALPRGKDDAEDGEEQRKRLKKEKGKYNKPHKSFKF